MATLLLFHHVLGVTAGLQEFADRLRSAGHDVVLPDLFAGATFDTIEEGVAFAEPRFDLIRNKAMTLAEEVMGPFVSAGFSLGTVPAQQLAQTKDRVLGAIIYDGGEPTEAFGTAWPKGTELQVHVVENDEWIDLDAARSLTIEAEGELFVYPGSAHLIADSSTVNYDSEIRDRIISRSLLFLERLDLASQT